MARRPDKREVEILSEDNLREIRHNLAHVSLPAVRDLHEQAYRDCRLVYNNVPSPRQIQTRAGLEAVVEVAMSADDLCTDRKLSKALGRLAIRQRRIALLGRMGW